MAQNTQIIPKYNYPHIEIYVNDYTIQENDSVATSEDDSTKFVYPVLAPSGKDNLFVKVSSRTQATSIFGKSNFRKYGQPYMQALHDLDQEDTSVYIMRVMPDNATYANAEITAWYKIDTDYTDAHKRKFRVKFTSSATENVAYKDYADSYGKNYIGLHDADRNHTWNTVNDAFKQSPGTDGEGYTGKNIMLLNSAGRGDYGNKLSVRISQNYEYEKEFGIKMYNFEVLDSTNGLKLVANYIASDVTSTKYMDETPTLIDDVLQANQAGTYPVEVYTDEAAIEDIYDTYVGFLREWHDELTEEYEAKVVQYAIPDSVMNGETEATAEQLEQIEELLEIQKLEAATADAAIPELDEFDLFFGREVASTTSMLPGLFFVSERPTDAEINAMDDYDEKDYTDVDILDVTATRGITLNGGTNGYFDTPRTEEYLDSKGQLQNRVWSVAEEVENCYNCAFNGTYDSKILSKYRMPITVFFDASYPFSVKQTLYELAIMRDSARVYLDASESDEISSVSSAIINSLKNKYKGFDHHIASIDITRYAVREEGTMKRCDVSSSYFLSAAFANHVRINGNVVPLVKDNCILEDYIKDTVYPVIDESKPGICELLNNNRFNYFECLQENTYRRAIQNTRQTQTSDLLEENNSLIYYELKNEVEKDASGQMYNFADESIRQAFCNVENAKFSTWEGNKLQSFNIRFSTSQYEFNRSILHLYCEIVFRGLTKVIIVEIDINRRSYSSGLETE